MHTMHMPENFTDWNEKMVGLHDPEQFHHHPQRVVRWIEGARVRQVLKLLNAGPDHKVLDVGCGAGNVLEQVSGKQRAGIDLSTSLIARARERLPEVDLNEGNAEELPWKVDQFDRVVCTSVLSHVYRPEQVLNECYRVLKPGGRLVVSVSNEDAIENGIKLARRLGLARMLFGKGEVPSANVYSSEYHLHHFNINYLRESAEDLPSEKKVVKIPWIWPVHLIAVYEK